MAAKNSHNDDNMSPNKRGITNELAKRDTAETNALHKLGEDFSYAILLKDWAASSSCNGIPNIVRASTIILKLFWLCLFLSGAALTIWNICFLVSTYLAYPVIISMNATFASALPFPGVTICNANIIRKSMVHLAQDQLQNILNITFGGNDTSYLRTSQGRAKLRNDFYVAYATIPKHIRRAMGHQKSTFIVDCEFDETPCNIGNFKEHLSSQCGNCFTFEIDRYVHRTGSKYGLNVELYIEQDEYISELTEIAGAVVTIHAPGIMPVPDAEGYLVSPDKATFLGLTFTEIKRQPFPYPSECWSLSHEDAMLVNLFSELYNASYSKFGCHRTCYQQHLVKSCGCGAPLLPLEGVAIQSVYVNPTGQIPPCSTDAQRQCQLVIGDKFTAQQLPCNCSVSCDDVLYVVTQTSAIWPSDGFSDIYYSELAARDPHFGDLVAARANGSNPGTNLINLKVFYQEFNYERIEETPAYEVNALLADIGGALGLYLGLSTIALFEFVELVVDFIRIGIVRFRAGIQP